MPWWKYDLVAFSFHFILFFSIMLPASVCPHLIAFYCFSRIFESSPVSRVKHYPFIPVDWIENAILDITIFSIYLCFVQFCSVSVLWHVFWVKLLRACHIVFSLPTERGIEPLSVPELGPCPTTGRFRDLISKYSRDFVLSHHLSLPQPDLKGKPTSSVCLCCYLRSNNGCRSPGLYPGGTHLLR